MTKKKEDSIFPDIISFDPPQHIDEYPVGPGFRAGHLVEDHAGWRTFRPVVSEDECTGCWMCYLVCPDGAVYKRDGRAAVNYRFCKGCGICAHQCPTGAVSMQKESDHER